MATDLETLRAAALRQPGARQRDYGIKFQCPACRGEGHDKAEDNACLFFTTAKWSCAWAHGTEHGRAHWDAIGRALDASTRRNGYEASTEAGPHAGNTGGSATSPAPAPGAVLVRLADVQPEPVEWLWTNRIAVGKLTLIVGDVGAGKTYLSTDVTARVTRGSAWPDGAPSGAPGHVILLTSEDGIADTIRPRLDRQGGDPARVDVLRAVELDNGAGESAFNLERDLPALEGAIVATAARVVIADPLSAYLGRKDSYKDAEIRGLLTPLADLADRRRVALLGLLHLTKAQQRRILHRVQASIAFVAQARTVLAVGEDPAALGRRLVAPLKNNLGPFPPVLAFRIGDDGLRWEPGAVEGTADALLAGDDAPTRTDQRERDDAKTFLRHLLREGPVPSKQVEADAKANGIAQRTLWRAKAELGIHAERARTTEGNTGPWYWLLPLP